MNASTAAMQNITPSAASTATLRSAEWFDSAHSAPEQSPIDEFRSNLYKINAVYLGADDTSRYSSVLGSLAYLGMVSAFESFIRALLRRLIIVDEVCKDNAGTRMVTYAAAVNHDSELLPEALLESISFASTKAIATELRTICEVKGMSKEGAVPIGLKALFSDFETICQIRHCGVHRFGKLGSNQALRLGMRKHKDILEKPLALNVAQLEQIAAALEALACGLNSHCFSEIIQRTNDWSGSTRVTDIRYAETWSQDWATDQARFMSYYNIFSSSTAPYVSPSAGDVYSDFLKYMASTPKHNMAGASKAKAVAKASPPS